MGMATTNTLMVDFADLRYLVISCPNCKTEVVLDAADAARLDRTSHCPTCVDSGYEDSFLKAVGDFRAAYQKFVDGKRNRVRVQLTLAP